MSSMSSEEQKAAELKQAARELLLAQASDWAFIIKTGTMVEYAVRRTKEHVLRLYRGEQQRHQKTNHRGHNEQFDERKTAPRNLHRTPWLVPTHPGNSLKRG